MAKFNFQKALTDTMSAAAGGIIGGVVKKVIPTVLKDAKMNALAINGGLLLLSAFGSQQKNKMLVNAALGLAGVAAKDLLRDGLGFNLRVAADGSFYVASESFLVANEQSAATKKIAKQVETEMTVKNAIDQLDANIENQNLARVAGELDSWVKKSPKESTEEILQEFGLIARP